MSSRSTQIIGGDDRQHAHVDGDLNALQVSVTNPNNDPIPISDPIARATDLGHVFSAAVLETLVAQLSAYEILIRVGSQPVSWMPVFAVPVNFTSELFEAATVTDPGTAVSVNNRNRTLLFSTGVTVFTAPTLSDIGTSLGAILLPEDVLRPTNAPIILEANTDYVVQLTNIGVADSPMSVTNLFIDRSAA